MKFPVLSKVQAISDGISFVEEELKKYKLKNKQIAKTLLLVEESLNCLVENLPTDSFVEITTIKRIGNISIKLVANGEPIIINTAKACGINFNDLNLESEAEFVVRNRILASFDDQIHVNNRHGKNSIKILAKKSDYQQSIIIICALLLAALVGSFMKLVLPIDVINAIDTYLLSPIKTIFMNALKVMVAPIIFFSITSSVASLGDIKVLGKMGIKILIFYIFTSIIATGSSLFVGASVNLAEVVDFSNVKMVVDAPNASLNLFQTIINIVPTNFIKSFLEVNMLQIIFLAFLLGIAATFVAKKNNSLATFFESGNALFIKATGLVVKFLPIMLFCSVCSLFSTTNLDTIKSLLKLFGVTAVLILFMMIIYCLMLLVFAKINPLTFIKKAGNVWIAGLTLCSSSATLPISLKCCNERLGINPKISSFSIPLGSQINMDGATCVYMMVITFLAHVYKVPLDGSTIATLFFMSILLSIASPGLPASGLVSISVMLLQLGIPVESLGIIISIFPLLDMLATANNVIGDIVCTIIVAKNHNFLDMKKFNE